MRIVVCKAHTKFYPNRIDITSINRAYVICQVSEYEKRAFCRQIEIGKNKKIKLSMCIGVCKAHTKLYPNRMDITAINPASLEVFVGALFAQVAEREKREVCRQIGIGKTPKNVPAYWCTKGAY